MTIDPHERSTRLRLAHEAMLAGMLVNRAILPQVVLETGGFDAMNDVAIDLWMGASPIYTQRTRRLMRIDGDDVAAIMKTLQLDVGFVHQYMDVAYVVHDERHGEFWLNHCGALLDAEPFGEERVFGMCHTIEDPTFDATALATNPRARIRPIHRPPRNPADRHPHCHWTITIDDDNEPVGPAVLTRQVGALALASVPNEPDGDRAADGRADYSGPFDPTLTLASLSSVTLRAMQEEFVVQTHLLAASGELALRMRFGDAVAARMLASGYAGVAWTTSRRLGSVLVLGDRPGAAGVASVLSHQPLLPPGLTREISIDDDGGGVTLELVAQVDGLLDPAHPGIPGLLARGDRRGLEVMAQAVDARARLTDLGVDGRSLRARFTIDPSAAAVGAPEEAALMESLAGSWVFTIPR